MIGSFLLLATTLTPDSTQFDVTVKLILVGIGLGPAIPLFTLAIQNAVPPPQIGVATAAATFFRQMGATVGLAIVGTVVATTIASDLPKNLTTAMNDVPPALRDQIMEKRADADGSRVAFDTEKARARVDAQLDKLPEPQRTETMTKAHAGIESVSYAFKRTVTDSLIACFWLSLAVGIAGFAVTAFLPSLPLRRGGPPKPAAVD
jgi:hypothetical protein